MQEVGEEYHRTLALRELQSALLKLPIDPDKTNKWAFAIDWALMKLGESCRK